MDNTPVIVGAGQYTERLDAADYRGLSAVEVAAEAARAAFADALSLERLGPEIDLVATTRTFEDSAPHLAFPFGKSDNFPRSICARLGIDPAEAVWEDLGGDTPQLLVNETFERVAAGRCRAALLTGAEAISTARHLQKQGREVDWSEVIGGQVEDRLGTRSHRLATRSMFTHGLLAAPPLYGLCENARRGALGLDREACRAEMARWFAPFTRVAAGNPYASTANRAYSAEELATLTDSNYLVADPYPRLMVSRDQVNQGAALIVTSAALARELGIPQDQWLYLHGYATAAERPLEERPDLGDYPAATRAARAALEAAGVGVDDIDLFDLYSCFPIAVSRVAESLGLAPDDPRGLTVTGGLPYFGGPGNNYSMHGIATVAHKLRGAAGRYAFVGANGGFLSKYAAGVYSNRPAPFRPCRHETLQAELDAVPAPPFTESPEGGASIETYTVMCRRDGQPHRAAVIGRTRPGGLRFMSVNEEGDSDTLRALLDREPLGAAIEVRHTEQGNRFRF